MDLGTIAGLDLLSKLTEFLLIVLFSIVLQTKRYEDIVNNMLSSRISDRIYFEVTKSR